LLSTFYRVLLNAEVSVEGRHQFPFPGSLKSTFRRFLLNAGADILVEDAEELSVNLQTQIQNPKPHTANPKINPKPLTQNPKFHTTNPKPQPSTLNPQPQTISPEL
jgi:hypothetical protein